MAAERDNRDEKQRDAAESDNLAADNVRADADVAKLTADLDDLRQTLLRRQADFDNYRKRIEKERLEESKRATARVVEALIPIVDGLSMPSQRIARRNMKIIARVSN
jgi:molecular chaperone GrpE